MVKLAALAMIGLLALGYRCKQREAEPNPAWPFATATGTIPSEHAQTVCGSTFPSDEDWWRIALDYQTTVFVEGEARLVLQSKIKPALLKLRLYEPAFGGGFKMIGSWYTTNGYLDTGQLGLSYYKSAGMDHIYACVTSGLGSADYFLSFW